MATSRGCAQYSRTLAGVLILNVFLVGCATRVAILKLPDVGRERWVELKAIGDDVGTRFGFVSDSKELLGHEIGSNGRWVVVGAYSNRRRGLRELQGGHSHVEFFIFAQPDMDGAKISIHDYGNTEQSEYTRALEVALTEGFHGIGIIANTGWQSHVVNSLEP